MGPISIDKRCCVPGCTNTRAGGNILHTFPHPVKEPERFKTWLYAIGGDVLALDNLTVFKYRKVCHDHFSLNYNTISKRLCPNAIPTLKLPGFHKYLRQPLAEVSNTVVDKLDYNLPSTSSGISGPITFQHQEKHIGKPLQKFKKQSNCSFPLSQADIKMNEKCKEIKFLKQKIRRIHRSKVSYSEKLKKALKLSENSSFIMATRKFTAAAFLFLSMQFKQSNKEKFGRRYSKDEKILSLAFYKMGPKAYRWLRNIFVLPAPITLSRMISRANLRAGINDCIFSSLKKRAAKMKETDKLCLLLFDEMALSPHFDFSPKKDLIQGFVNYGYEAQNKIADHVLVFMIRGVIANYKQPLAYCFSHGATPKVELKKIIKKIIREIQDAGLNVVGTICDQGASNVSAIKDLINETKIAHLKDNKTLKRNIFSINKKEIVPIFDVPHLIKGVRNNLLNKDLTFIIENKKCRAKWEHIVQLYKENPSFNGLRFLPKLTEAHVVPEKIKKMKVKCATQVFSASVAMCMGYFADKNILPPQSRDTATAIQFFDKLFDSLNGSYGHFKNSISKQLLGPVKISSCHYKMWSEAKIILNSMKFVKKDGKEVCVPSINNWILSVENVEYLTESLLKNKNVKAIWMRHFNQDPLENFFGSVRSHGLRNTNPTCAAFEIAFASILVNNLFSHSKGSNCENDSTKNVLMNSLKKIFFQKSSPPNEPNLIDEEDLLSDNILISIESKSSQNRGIEILKYVAGYVVKKTIKNISKKCKICLKNLTTNDHDQFEFILRKERIDGKHSLVYPSKEAVEMFSNIQDVVQYVLKNKSHVCNVKAYITTLITLHVNLHTFISCKEHSIQLSKYIVDLTCKLFIFHWCKTNNRILMGLTRNIDECDYMQITCLCYVNKRKK